MQGIVIFGIGHTASVLSYYIRRWKLYSIKGYVIDPEYAGQPSFENQPVVSLDDVATFFPPSQGIGAFVAIGYQNLNGARADKVRTLRDKGYEMVSVINPDTLESIYLEHGENCLVIPDYTLMTPSIRLKNNVFIWNRTVMGHDAFIGENVWISSGTTLGGNVTIGDHSFLGMMSCVKNGVRIGRDCIIGMGTSVHEDLADNTVLHARRAETSTCRALDFARFMT